MTTTTCWESVKLESATLVDKLKDLIREGNIRRIRIQHEGRTIAEFPMTAGVVAVVLAPVAAAVGALLAVLKDCTIDVERREHTESRGDETTGEVAADFPSPPAA
jgi:hypothetical protein